MQLSVIILNYNAAPFLAICLDSVQRALVHLNAEVIVVDNASTDRSLEMLATHFKDVKVIANKENIGFSAGNNIGVAAAQGEYLCILNPDTIVSEQVFEVLYAFAKANPKTAFTTTQLLDGTGAFLPESKRNVPTPKIARQKLLGNATDYFARDVDSDANGKIEVLVGAMMFCKKSVYEELGGFDPRYFMYGEDIDLSYTALKHGFTNYYMGTLKTIHFKGESTTRDKTYIKRFYGAMGLFYDKHFKRNALEKVLVALAIKTLIVFNNKNRKNHVFKVTNTLLVTNDRAFNLDTATQKLDLTSLLNSQMERGTQITWDVATLEYKTIIDFMESHIGNEHTYRFLDKDRKFILGSDTSDSKGVVSYLS